jgi:hypothetical protein
MTLDKETLLRNRFWVMLGVFLPLVLIALIYLSTGVAGELDNQRNHIKKVETDLDGNFPKVKGKTDSELERLKSKTAQLDQRRVELWKEAWALQDGLQVWPKAIEEAALLDKNGGKPLTERKFGETLSNELCAEYAQNKVYGAQYEELAQIFHEDLSKLGKGKRGYDPVIFKEGWKNVIQHVAEWKTATQGPPSYKEVWVAQEDFWVQRELLLALNKANKSVATFKKVKAGKDIDPNDPLQGSFENRYWHLDLKIAKKDQVFVLTGRITNPEKSDDGQDRPKKMQQIGLIFFWLYLDKDPNSKVPIAVQGENLAWGKSQEIRETPLLGLDLAPQGIFGVEQVLQPKNSPIKRIDQLVLGSQSHRTYGSLNAPAFLRDSFVARPPPKGGAAPGKEAAPTNLTDNGVLSQRYYNPQTDKTEVRRMPIGMVLVVDQAHIPDVEAALVSSRLRFQITQVLWQHFRGALGSGLEEDKNRKGPRVEPKAGEGEEPVSNLAELVIYGTASLYERPTDKKTETPAKDKDKPRNDKRPKVDPKTDKSK